MTSVGIDDFDGVIFDLDGTLIDSNGVWEKIDRRVLEKNGVYLSAKEIKSAAAMSYDEVLELFLSKGVNYTLDELKDEFDKMAVSEYRYRIFLKDGVRDYLDALKKRGKRIGLATASPKRLYEPVLRNNHVYGMFDAFCTTDEVGAEKDFPDVYLETASRLGIAPDRCVVFEDVLKGIASAKNGGMYAVAVYDKYSEDDFITMRNMADGFIMSFTEMPLLISE